MVPSQRPWWLCAADVRELADWMAEHGYSTRDRIALLADPAAFADVWESMLAAQMSEA